MSSDRVLVSLPREDAEMLCPWAETDAARESFEASLAAPDGIPEGMSDKAITGATVDQADAASWALVAARDFVPGTEGT